MRQLERQKQCVLNKAQARVLRRRLAKGDYIPQMNQPDYGWKRFMNLNFLFEDGLFVNIRAQGFQSLFHNRTAKGLFLFVRKRRIAKRMRNRYCRNDAICSDRLGDRRNRADVHDGKTCAFDFFRHCCTATCTGSSGAGQNDRVHLGRQQLLRDFRSKGLG